MSKIAQRLKEAALRADAIGLESKGRVLAMLIVRPDGVLVEIADTVGGRERSLKIAWEAIESRSINELTESLERMLASLNNQETIQ